MAHLKSMSISAASKKTVAVIGAGPAGLTTAKALLEAGLDPRVFEAKNEVGGLWNVNEYKSTLTCPPRMRTNLSKWTCSFSDFSWQEKHFHDVENLKKHGYESLPVFPQARDVHLYLKDYAARFIPTENISLRTCVTKLSQFDDPQTPGVKKWRVEWERASDNQGIEESSGVFDHVAIASGFFSTPHIPAIPGLQDFSKDGLVFHSSNYQEFLHTSKKTKQPKKIVVVGGCLSAVEVVSDLLFHQGGLKGTEVVHLLPRPFWVLPRYLRIPDASGTCPPSFLPLDLVLYDAYRRRTAQKAAEAESQPISLEEKYLRANEYMKSKAGNGDQTCLSPILKIGPEEMRLPPYVSISDSYANFVREGAVKLQRGYLASIQQEEQSGAWSCLEISSVAPNATGFAGVSKERIDGVDMIIFATGYKPTTSFPPFLSKEILEELSYQPDDNFLPVLLYNQILHPSLMSYPSDSATRALGKVIVHAGFIGMYKGPYFGVLESQARYLAQLFKGNVKPPPKDELEKQIAEFKAMRDGRNSGNSEQRGQWSWGDYLGIMDDLQQRIVGIERQQVETKGGIDRAMENAKSIRTAGDFAPVIPAHYALHTEAESQNAISTLIKTAQEAILDSRFTSKAVFRSLQGSWKLTRTLDSRLKEMPSGTFVGIAKFIPRPNTFDIKLPAENDTTTELSCSLKKTHLVDHADRPGEEREINAGNSDITEYIYCEHGKFTLSTPPYFSFPAVRKYIYRYHPGTDTISAWFVKPQSGFVPSETPPSPGEEREGEVDYLFHEVEFVGEGTHENRIAKGKEHLCEKDLYKAKYNFKFGLVDSASTDGTELCQLTIGYDVQGPRKDYTSQGVFQRV